MKSYLRALCNEFSARYADRRLAVDSQSVTVVLFAVVAVTSVACRPPKEAPSTPRGNVETKDALAASAEKASAAAVPRFDASAWNLPAEDLFGFVEIPAGTLMMGSAPNKDAFTLDSELPSHSVFVPAFFIGRYEVTVGQYKACVSAGACQPMDQNAVSGREELPVRYVSWHEALAYCRWLEARLKSWSAAPKSLADALAGRRDRRMWHVTLPSEAEWERAARGDDRRIYPWGNAIQPSNGQYTVTRRREPTGPTSVGAFPDGASPYGLLDMSGNVSEWTRSHFKPYPYRANDGRESLTAPDRIERVVRGGSFQNVEENVRVVSRFRDTPTGRSDFIGFRVAISGMSDTALER